MGVTTSSNAERLIRRGFRIAYRLKADWHVVYVQEGKLIPEPIDKRINALQELTSRLGGIFEVQFVERDRDVASVLIGKAGELDGTQMIVGQSKRNIWNRLLKGSVVKTILRRARHLDVLVVSDFDPNVKPPED